MKILIRRSSVEILLSMTENSFIFESNSSDMSVTPQILFEKMYSLSSLVISHIKRMEIYSKECENTATWDYNNKYLIRE